VNLALAFVLGARWPSFPHVAASMIVGLFAYGISLVLFVVGLRHLGTARTGAYYSIAPFFGAVLSILLLDERLSIQLVAAGAFMALGLWLHLTEKHVHSHTHPTVDHEHEHTHDEHHDHSYPIALGTTHTHVHHHESMTHTHEHYPDTHHRHEHDEE
jgi:hypothetical protein